MLSKKFVKFAFNECVEILVKIGEWFGMSYEEINIWIFCILWPLITISLLLTVIMLW